MIIQTQKELVNKLVNDISKEKLTIICGNGGSLAEAQHFAGELVPYDYPCIALNDPSVITAIGNDEEFNAVFYDQIRTFRKLTKVIILLTTSGKSKNILETLDLIDIISEEHNISTYIITGDIYQPDLVEELCEDTQINTYKISTPQEAPVIYKTAIIQEDTLRILHDVYIKLTDLTQPDRPE